MEYFLAGLAIAAFAFFLYTKVTKKKKSGDSKYQDQGPQPPTQER